jgi:A/G-specific adenine glycosylase
MVAEALVQWFKNRARSLPWRTEPRQAYPTLVSEIMLQQTQVDRVAPRFVAFLERFPTIGALASASEDEVVAAWSGLGYYRRARMLHRLAREIVASGEPLPTDPKSLRRLPGVGEYTAAAVSSLVADVPEAVLDGNVLRVGARILGEAGDAKRAATRSAIRRWVETLFPGQSPGAVNEALMELGATVCTPSSPRCGACPLAEDCVARQDGLVDSIPAPRSARATEHCLWTALCVVDGHQRLLLRRVDEGPILLGTWLPPLTDSAGRDVSWSDMPCVLGPSPPRSVGQVRHAITFRRIVVDVLVATGSPVAGDDAVWRWWHPEDAELAVSNLTHKLWKTASQSS